MNRYYFTYRHGELEAEVNADTELEAWSCLLGSTVPITVNIDYLNPDMWDLQDIEEEDCDR